MQGPSVFRGYWQRPDATAEAFREGWFRTGDVAVLDAGAYRIRKAGRRCFVDTEAVPATG